MKRIYLALLSSITLLLGCAPVPERKAQPSVNPAEVAAQFQRQQQAAVAATPPFDQSKWSKLTIGMKPREVFDLLGAPFEFRVLNGGEGKIEFVWIYLYDSGKTQVLARFGVPATAESVRTTRLSPVNPKQFEEALPKITGDLFDWTRQARPSPQS